MSKVAQIKAPIENEMEIFEARFKDLMRSKTPLLDKITQYIVKRKGKQVRPMFVFLSAKLNGQEVNDKSYRAAALIELLHTATLVHDDVVDDANLRRGFFSINALWKNKIAVLVGDYLLSKGLLLSVDNDDHDLLKIVSQAVKEMSEGELLQIEKARKLDIEEKIYYDIIRQKTASLIASCCAAGAASVTDDADEIERMRHLGELVGMAFQIKDDLFDYQSKNIIGKPTGIDIKEQKMTLPLIYALSQSDRKQKRWIINIVKKHNTDGKKVKELIQYVTDKGGLEYTKKVMMEYRDEALKVLDGFPESEARTSLKELIIYTTEREK